MVVVVALSFSSIFNFLTESAQYKCSYRRTVHHATGWWFPGLMAQYDNCCYRLTVFCTCISISCCDVTGQDVTSDDGRAI